MTEDRIERIARRLCALLGINADEQVGHGAQVGPDGYLPDIMLFSPRWRLMANDVKKQLAMDKAIQEIRTEDIKAGFDALWGTGKPSNDTL